MQSAVAVERPMGERTKMDILKVKAGIAPSGQVVFERLPFCKKGKHFELLSSPGMLLGFAKGDVVSFDKELAEVTLIERANNLATHVYLSCPVEDVAWLERKVSKEANGEVDGLTDQQIVITFPVSKGFRAIEKCLNSTVEQLNALSWHYGNVYDNEDGVTPLNWWLKDE